MIATLIWSVFITSVYFFQFMYLLAAGSFIYSPKAISHSFGAWQVFILDCEWDRRLKKTTTKEYFCVHAHQDSLFYRSLRKTLAFGGTLALEWPANTDPISSI